MSRRRFQDDNGAALVELALTAPLFILLMLGGIELGRIAYYAIEIQNAARAGASYGSTNIGNAANTTTTQQAAKNDAPDISDLVVVTPGRTCVCETYNASTGTASFNPSSGTVDCGASIITSCTVENSTTLQSVVGYVTVSTQANISPIVQIPSLPSTYTLNGYSALRILAN